MKQSNLFQLLALALTITSLGYAQTSLSGNLVETGAAKQALPQIIVLAQRVETDLTKGQPPVFGEARTDSKGQFTIKGLPAGVYKICVPNDGDLLDPCAWPAYYPVNQVSVPGPDVQVALTRGYRVFVRFDGSSDLLKPERGAVRPAVEAWIRDAKDNRIRIFDIWRRTETSVILSSVVPFDPSLKLVTLSSQFVLSDGEGRLLPGEGDVRPIPAKQIVSNANLRRFPGGGRISGEPTVLLKIAGRKVGGAQ